MIEVLKQALEALENHCGNYKLDDAGCERHDKAIASLNQALAELENQKPVAWMCSAFDGEPCEQSHHDECENPIPLYTHPPQRKPLTDDQIDLMFSKHWLYPGIEFKNVYQLGFRDAEFIHGIKEQA